MKHIEVAAAVIVNTDDQILLSLRAPGVHQGGKWEFPGGKFEAGESGPSALRRELKEELNIIAHTASEYLHLKHEYPEKKVSLYVYLVRDFSGEPRGMEGQAVRWFDVEDLAGLTFPDANYPILKQIEADFLGA
jgi:8-oxo-dGTP diphosphatase